MDVFEVLCDLSRMYLKVTFIMNEVHLDGVPINVGASLEHFSHTRGTEGVPGRPKEKGGPYDRRVSTWSTKRGSTRSCRNGGV